MAVLRLVPPAGAPIEVDKDQAIVGREPACDVPINDGSVSRRHARLERRGMAWFVVDQGSANGTYLDSQRVSDALLRPGQELRFGAVPFKVQILGDAPSADGTLLAPAGGMGMGYAPPPPMVPPTGAPPQYPGAPPAPPQWPGAPPPTPPLPSAPPAPPRAPAPPPAAPHPPAPAPAGRPPSPDTAPYRTGTPVPRAARPPRPRPAASEAPPAATGRSPWFWAGIGCGGCLLAVLLLLGGLGGFLYYTTRGPVDAVNAQLQQVRAGQIDAAYERLAPAYRQQVTREAFAAFVARHPALKDNTDSTFMSRSVEGSQATLGGYLTGPGGARETVNYTLVKSGGSWLIANMEVAADTPESLTESGPTGLRLDSVQARKRAVGSTVEVVIEMNVAGFAVRPADGGFEIDLALDVETTAPMGERVDPLSRDEVLRFQRRTSMERGAVAPMTATLTVDSSLPPGEYTVTLRVRDLVGGGQATQQARIALP